MSSYPSSINTFQV